MSVISNFCSLDLRNIRIITQNISVNIIFYRYDVNHHWIELKICLASNDIDKNHSYCQHADNCWKTLRTVNIILILYYLSYIFPTLSASEEMRMKLPTQMWNQKIKSYLSLIFIFWRSSFMLHCEELDTVNSSNRDLLTSCLSSNRYWFTPLQLM